MATMAARHCTGLNGEVVVSWDGFWWLSMAVEGLGMDIDGCEWLTVTIDRSQWLTVAHDGSRWLTVAVEG